VSEMIQDVHTVHDYCSVLVVFRVWSVDLCHG